mgnify:CR=1 FL=1
MLDYGIYSDCKKVNFQNDTYEYCKTPTGMLQIEYDLTSNKYTHGGGWLYIYFTEQSKTEDCIEFFSQNWENIIPKDMFQPDGYVDNPTYTQYRPNDGILTYILSEISEACHSSCDNADACHGFFQFYNAIF